ncbi:MAG TPA: tannase/feruloyl esterase family alpha/beta hydrolase, partial [Burkholderiaceae bacterium]|nr:tannase/feruloyl esterase family alpha/beta hydrolase [Burkholderiaceae bacterium]
MHPLKSATGLGLIALAGLTACGGGDDDDDAQKLPQLSAASAGTLSACATLLTGFTDANTTLTAATDVAAGTLTVGGTAVPAHCRVTGNMYSRTGSNGNYAIGFEMRLPQAWNGRFFYQGNGGLDGSVSTATGATGGGPLTHALLQGFAVISSNAGHTGAQTAIFGFDPQARLDYGYQAAQKLTPMAKALIAAA